MQQRLACLGGAGRLLTLHGAMKIAGLSEPEEIYRAMECGEFGYNEKLLVNGDPRHGRSWIQIESGSFIRWLERRSQLPIAQTKTNIQEILFKLGVMQAEIYDQHKTLHELVSLFTKQNSRPVVRWRRRERQKI